MDDKEFRKLHREDLIEIIYQYQRREQRLTQENELLKNQLKEKAITIQEAGSIANAALALNGVFEAAQKAADQYLLSLKALHEGGEIPQTVAPAPEPIPQSQPAPQPQMAAKPQPAPQPQMAAKPQAAARPKPQTAARPQSAAAKPQPPVRPVPQTGPQARPQTAPKPQNANETDDFIASLKDYLGM